MGRSRYKFFETNQPQFITGTLVNWIPLFSNPSITTILLNSLSYLQKNNRLIIYAYVIMENHFHLIASSKQLSKEIGIFKSFTARKIIDFLKEENYKSIPKQLNYYKLKHKHDRHYQVWQEGSHPELIWSDEMMIQKIEYIHYNPVKRGYVDEPEHWRYSSARNYAGLEGLLEVTSF